MSAQIAVDWGSSSFRAYLFDDSGALSEVIESEAGLKSVKEQGFEAVLFDSIGHWLQPGARVLFSGMITSRDGWIETPYLEAPLNLNELLRSAVTVEIKDSVQGIFLPGVCSRTPNTDVMRGEEIQLLGALESEQTGSQRVVVLPGTHSKWALTDGTRLQLFRTIVTGELFELLLKHSLVGSLSTSIEFRESAFAKGVHKGFSYSNIISHLFSARSSVLLNELESDEVHSYLSGMLIGNEIREARDMMNGEPVLIVGSEALVKKYHAAFSTLSLKTEIAADHAAARGFARLITLQSMQL